MVSLPERRREVTYLKNMYELSERRACGVVSMHRSSYRHEGKRLAVDATHAEVVRLSDLYPYWGYRKIYDLMDRGIYPVGRERVRPTDKLFNVCCRPNRFESLKWTVELSP